MKATKPVQILTTQATFECPACHQLARAEVQVPEPDWGAAENFSDLTSEDETTVTCSECSTEFQAYVFNNGTNCEITLTDHPKTRIHADAPFFTPPDEDDEWLNHETPKDPSTIFLWSFYEVRDILAEYGVDGRGVLQHSGPLINRMVFTQQISALEAYLGDTLTNLATNDAEVLMRLLTQDKELKEIKVSLHDIQSNPNLVHDLVRKHLQGLLYHNLAKVAVLFKIATKVDIWPANDTKEKLLKAIAYRHDCVHRNGKDQDGKQLTVFTTEYVNDILTTMVAFVSHIQKVCLKSEFAYDEAPGTSDF